MTDGKIVGAVGCLVQMIFRLMHSAGLLTALVLVAPAAVQEIPALLSLSPGVATAHPELVQERAALVEERTALHTRTVQHNAQCGAVKEGSASETSCRSVLSRLEADLNTHIEKTNQYNDTVRQAGTEAAASPHKENERHYTYAGNGLIAGTSWTLYASRKPGEPEQRMCDVIKHQAKLARSTYDQGVDCTRYQFVLGMAASLDAFTDLKNRVAFDDLTNGQFSAHEQRLYDKLRGKQFDELGCHSNGTMICLAALENEDIKAEHVVLYGPQVTRESLELWDKLVRDGRVKSVKVYINENDIVPGVSIAYADFKRTQSLQVAGAAISPGGYAAGKVIEEAPLFQIDSLQRTINETGPRLLVETFPCVRDRLSTDCHAMSMYKSKVNCTGKSSGKAVPGTALHGKDELPEPPLPCTAIGGKP
jgi:hypothetical protein